MTTHPVPVHPAAVVPRVAGAGAIALGLGFNVPYARLAAWFDYPAILRQPSATALRRFGEGGDALVLALGRDGSAFSLATIAGFAGLSPWLVATGAVQLRRNAMVPA